MRIAIITDVYQPNENGDSETISRLEEEFIERLMVYKVYSIGDANNNDNNHVFFKFSNLRLYDKFNFSFLLYNKFKKELDKYKPDIIHIMSESQLGLFSAKYAIENRIPYIASFTIDLNDYPKEISRSYIKEIHKYAFVNLASSNYAIEQLRSIGIIHSVKWNNGIDTLFYKPKKDKQFSEIKKILYVGDINKKYNMQMLLNIAYELNKQHYNYSFEIIGSGVLLKKLQSKNVKNVLCSPHLYEEAMVKKYREADVFIFAAKSSTYNDSVLKSMASGVPVIASYVGGIKDDLINGFNGYAIKKNDPMEFVVGIKNLFSDRDIYIDMCRNARTHTLGKSWKIATDELINYYTEATKGK